MRSFIATSSFWLLGGVVFLATGPAEMYMASVGAIVASLSGSPALLHSPVSALSIRRRHIALLSVVNTLWRLVVGAASDYLAAPLSSPASATRAGEAKLHQPAWRRHVRLVFVAVSCALLAAAFSWGATGLSTPAGLWVITFGALASFRHRDDLEADE